MSHYVEIFINAVNVGASVGHLALIAWLASQLRRQGREVVISRLVLRQRETSRAVVVMLAGLVVFIASNILELAGDVFHIDWVVNEVVETIALFVMLASLLKIASILRLPVRGRNVMRVDVAQVERP